MKKVIPNDAVLIPDTAERVFKGIIFDVYQWEQELFDGTKTTFEMLRRPDTIAVLCIVDGKIVVLEESQPHIGKRVNFPLGRIEPTDETPLDGAKREVLEETGYAFADWKLANVVQLHRKMEWFVYTYIASNVVSSSEAKNDAGEKITVTLKDFTEVLKMSQDRLGDFGEALDILQAADSAGSLMSSPEFTGQEVDR